MIPPKKPLLRERVLADLRQVAFVLPVFFFLSAAGSLLQWKMSAEAMQAPAATSTPATSPLTAAVISATAVPAASAVSENISLQAKAAFAYDLTADKQLYAKDEQETLSLASLTKIMTALVAIDSVPGNTPVAVRVADASGETATGVRAGERWQLADLLRFTLITSSNGGANAAAEAIDTLPHFTSRMEQMARTLGLPSLHFTNENGLDAPGEPSGGIGNAEDVSFLLAKAYALHPEIFGATATNGQAIQTLDGQARFAASTNMTAGKIPGLLAAKTGYTDRAGGNLSILFVAPAKNGELHTLVATVLGSTFDGRFSDMEKLADFMRLETEASGQ